MGIPRDGGIADLLAEAASPNPRFAAVICEDIERSGRDTFNALKLERQLADAGIPLLAADEPIDLEGMNATTILVRRVKQGVAEWYRFQIKEKAWKGLREHALDGWNIGPAPYGYHADRIPHPVPVKAAQGRTKTRLVLDPERAPVVAQIFTWRTVDRLGIPEITDRLNADHDTYPPPDPATGWTARGSYSILANPKYTGHMVFGRRRTHGGKRGRRVPPDQWIWSPEPVHPAIITRATWDAAQAMGAEHGTSRDGRTARPPAGPADLPAARPGPVPPLPAAACTAPPAPPPATTPAGRTWTTSTTGAPTTPPTPATPAQAPGHPATVTVREDLLLETVRQFFATRIFGPDRATLLRRQLPAGAAEDAARRGEASRPAAQAAQADRRHRERPRPRSRGPRRAGPQLGRRHRHAHPPPASGSPNSKPNATTSTPKLTALASHPDHRRRPRRCWTSCPCSGPAAPTPRSGSSSSCSTPSTSSPSTARPTTRSPSAPPSPPPPRPP